MSGITPEQRAVTLLNDLSLRTDGDVVDGWFRLRVDGIAAVIREAEDRVRDEDAWLSDQLAASSARSIQSSIALTGLFEWGTVQAARAIAGMIRVQKGKSPLPAEYRREAVPLSPIHQQVGTLSSEEAIRQLVTWMEDSFRLTGDLPPRARLTRELLTLVAMVRETCARIADLEATVYRAGIETGPHESLRVASVMVATDIARAIRDGSIAPTTREPAHE